MIGWLAVFAVSCLFAFSWGMLLRLVTRPFDETDERCSQIEDDLNARYGGWRN